MKLFFDLCICMGLTTLTCIGIEAVDPGLLSDAATSFREWATDLIADGIRKAMP